MHVFFRWWGQHRTAGFLIVLVLFLTWVIRAYQGAGIVDLARGLTWPWQNDGAIEQPLIDAQTEELRQRVAELEAQNTALKKLLELPPVPGRTAVAAPVISRAGDNWWQQLTVGKGSRAGINVDAVVTAPGGLVGRVVSVTPTTSRVLLVTDPSSQIGVTITRSREVGILRGRSERYGMIEFFQKGANVKPDDALVTSALSSRFPPGLPIGKVTSLKAPQGTTSQAIVEFTVPLDTLEWVNVLF